MNNVFNRVKMLKSSDDCNKFSKSVSYETLIGGTATTGREYKQTRRLFLGSADKPLTAVGTLTSLLCNSAKVVEKLFYRHAEPKAKNPKNNIQDWILHFAFAPFRMTFFALVFTLATISESQASKTCDCGTAGHETECCWEITEVTKDGKTEKVLTISPGVDENGNTYTSVQMKNYGSEVNDAFIGNGYYQYKTTAPWARQGVTSLVVNDGIESIGQNAFKGEVTIKTADIDNVKTIKDTAFFFATGLTDVKMTNTEEVASTVFYAAFSLKNIEMPNVKYIGNNAFESCRKLESIYMPSVETVSWSAFWDTNLNSIDMPNVSKIRGSIIGQKLKYIGFSTQKDAEGCLIDDRGERVTKGDSNCVTEISIDDDAFIKNSFLSNCSADGNGCGSCGYDYVMHGLGCVADCGAGYLGKEGRCIDSSNGCGENYKNMGGYCNRIRYTPAEAAKVLRDDGKNEVTITFKQ